ncbi:uncharacterized protein M6B38_268810 [Iris pallida]|uniref:Secreted protein n=1 Tax=Iris pallida TaxID=29817 RepID=A0AAX6I9I0_IRIPA|nr:uncharacterized protein M6B38_268810 [Iris pallida]
MKSFPPPLFSILLIFLNLSLLPFSFSLLFTVAFLSWTLEWERGYRYHRWQGVCHHHNVSSISEVRSARGCHHHRRRRHRCYLGHFSPSFRHLPFNSASSFFSFFIYYLGL